MNSLCCISLNIAARIIGACGLSASILMMNVLMSDFFSGKEGGQFLATIEKWALLGLNWTHFLKNTQISRRVQVVLLCFLAYSILLLFASAFLALGTVCRRPKYAVPWLYLQMVSIFDQSISLGLRITHKSHYDDYYGSTWYIPLSILYLVATIYFWMIVYSARQEWYKYVPPYNNFSAHNTGSAGPTNTDFNLPKTPSFIAQNQSIFDAPPPYIPIKYDIV